MTATEKKEYLRRYKQAVLSQQQIDDEIRELSLISVPPVKMDGMPHAFGSSADLSVQAVKIERLVEKLRKKIDERLQIRREIIDRIEAMDDETEKLVLKCRYIHFCTWEQTAEKAHVAERTVYRIHGNALVHLKID